ncbi:hypothetical protein [Actinophytocola oryzae]|uniref:hypothetical protein n=1 Tax=Actinophytocola oryzae TaxID=502181 RepID=UPI001AAF1448|nr:hypothetical protein [Actinophytocola oryzae]
MERDTLIVLDFDPDVVGVASQPFWLFWTAEDGKPRSHAPDYFARLADDSTGTRSRLMRRWSSAWRPPTGPGWFRCRVEPPAPARRLNPASTTSAN